MQPIIRYFSALRRQVQLEPEQRLLYVRRPWRDFTRASPLTFAHTVSLIVDLARQSLAVELGRFFHWRPQDIVTKSAFCQRRRAILPVFFRDLFAHTADLFYRCFTDHKRWKGKRLFATDGTGLRLPNEPWIGETFGFHLNQHDQRPSVRLLLTLDLLLNNVVLRVDRHGSDYLIRMPLQGANVVKAFVQSGEDEQVITIKLGVGRAYRTLKELGLEPKLHAEFTIRLVRVELDTGESEVLMTSLTDRGRYPHSDFKWLYGKRWGVETAIFTLKSFLQLALISAYTQPGVEQDLWASFAFYNQQSALVAASEAEVKRRTQHRQYTYKINRNVTAGMVQKFLYHIYLDGGPATWRSRTQVLLKLMPRYTEPYRPDRDRKRERKIMRANSRHIHEKNYRKAM